MDKIASFKVDHTKLKIGMYTSRVDGDIITYDIRMVRPNSGAYIAPASLHTIEHLFATYARNTDYSSDVIYIGPMGCRTGFYFIVRNTLTQKQAIEIVKASMFFILKHQGAIPGATEAECGNYLEHDLAAAKKDIQPIFDRLQGYTIEMLSYNY